MKTDTPLRIEDWLSARAKASPKSLALIFEGKSWTYGELDNEVSAICSQLIQLVNPGQHVGTLLPNSPLTVMIIHALARLGVVMVPLNIRLTGRDLQWQVRQSDCHMVIYAPETADLAKQLFIESISLIPEEDILTGIDPGDFNRINHFNINNVQAIVFTSGTTGVPKGAMLTFSNHFWSANASAYRLGVHTGDRWLCCLPMYHVGGLAIIFRSCLYGTAVVLHKRFDLAEISDSLENDDITMISLVPTMAHRLIDYLQDRSWPKSLRHILLGGAAADPQLLKRCREISLPVCTTYGLTEASSQVATSLPEQTYAKPGSVGKPLIFSTVEIVDDSGNSMEAGQTGEIVVSGPNVMVGYYKDENSTAAALKNGRLYTGDIGYLDNEGDLFVLQRRSDMILCGGENIYPSEVEQVFIQHPGIAAVSVVGIEDEEWGQCVAAMIELNNHPSLNIEEIIKFGRAHLAGYKIPRIIKIVDQLPQTASGKINRQAVLDSLKNLERNQVV